MRRDNKFLRDTGRHDFDMGTEGVMEEYLSRIDFGALERPYFYLILDNVKALFKIERYKKVIEKLAICQSRASCFSIIVINDALVKEMEVFHTSTNVFSEYMFTIYYFSPMTRPMTERMMHQTLSEMFLSDE